MSSIFDLKQSASELPSLNQGTAKLIYEQHPPTRDVTGSNFPNGSIHIRWQVAGTRWWIPSRSYIRMRARIRSVAVNAAAAIQPTLASDVAPNMELMANLFQSLEFRIADKTVARTSDYVAQVDSLEKRLTKSKSWLDSVGQDLEFLNPNQYQRANEIALDGLESKNSGTPPVVTRLQAGFPALTTIGWTKNTKLLTFALGGVDILVGPGKLNVGDVITTNGEGAFTDGQSVRITKLINSLTANGEWLNVDTDNGVANLAASVNVFTIRRANDVISNQSLNRNEFEMIWQPPLSIFKVGHAMPAGKYELVLNPQNVNSYQKRAVESALLNLVPLQDTTVVNDFEFVVDNMYLYLATVEGPRVDNITYYMSLEQTRCQAERVDSAVNGSLQQKNFDVSPSTYALTVAFQDQAASGDNTLFSASKFKIRSKGEFTDAATSLNRMYIQYAGQNKPSPDADPSFVSPVNYLKQRYADSILYSGAYFDCGGAETFKDWLNRGMYFYFSWPKDGLNESTRVSVNTQLGVDTNNDGSVLLFDHAKKIVIIQVREGRVVDVLEQDA